MRFYFFQSKCVVIVSSSCDFPSSETQGRSVGPGEKAWRKFSSTGGKAPGYRLSPEHSQTDKRMLAPDWAQKMLCITVPNRWTVSPEFLPWVRTRRLFSRHSSSARFVQQAFVTRNEETTDESKNVSDTISRSNSIWHWENSVSDGSQCIVYNRKFKKQRWRESKKSNSLARQNKNFPRASRFFVHFVAVTARLPRENA